MGCVCFTLCKICKGVGKVYGKMQADNKHRNVVKHKKLKKGVYPILVAQIGSRKPCTATA